MLNSAATTSIGGMGKFSLTNSMDLQGAKVVIVPDRDEPGIKDADKVAEYFPDAKWLYPFPEKNWEKLPKSDGLDIFDWIEQGKFAPVISERRSERRKFSRLRLRLHRQQQMLSDRLSFKSLRFQHLEGRLIDS
jgi:hypothetical protein